MEQVIWSCVGARENDWLHLLGGGETCPVAGRKWEAVSAVQGAGSLAWSFPAVLHPFSKCTSIRRGGNTPVYLGEVARVLR